MNTEEVCAMIDAITEGQEFTLSVPVPVGEDSLTLKFNEDEISVYGAHGFATAIRNPRNVREIAGALVAWANRKDGDFQGLDRVKRGMIKEASENDV